MTIPSAYNARAERVGFLTLVEIDSTEGIFNFLLGTDGWFQSTDGKKWIGSRLISASEIELSVNGTAPGIELSLTFIQDPDQPDLVSEVRALGSDIVRGRPCRLYIQYMEAIEEFYKPVYAPQLITQRTMMNMSYHFEGPQIRRLSLQVEGPFNLRSKPVGGRYNTADHSRRIGLPPGTINPSLEFMPVHGVDEQTLFGL